MWAGAALRAARTVRCLWPGPQADAHTAPRVRQCVAEPRRGVAAWCATPVHPHSAARCAPAEQMVPDFARVRPASTCVVRLCTTTSLCIVRFCTAAAFPQLYFFLQRCLLFQRSGSIPAVLLRVLQSRAPGRALWTEWLMDNCGAGPGRALRDGV